MVAGKSKTTTQKTLATARRTGRGARAGQAGGRGGSLRARKQKPNLEPNSLKAEAASERATASKKELEKTKGKRSRGQQPRHPPERGSGASKLEKKAKSERSKQITQSARTHVVRIAIII